MSGQWHPDTEAIASLRAGLAEGLRGRRVAAHVARCARCASVGDEVGAVSSVLASVPAPSLPEAFERAISAALAAEAAARETAVGVPGVPGAAGSGAGVGSGAGSDSGERASPGPGRRAAGSRGRKRSLRLRVAVAVPVAACLLAGSGYLLSILNTSVPTAASAPYSAAASASAPARHAMSGAEANRSPAFLVTRSGTRYEAATLRAQVRGELSALVVGPSAPRAANPAVPSPVPSTAARFGTNGQSQAASSAGGASSSVARPSATLLGCVLHLTGSAVPDLVDLATYQGNPAYVIAVRDHAWVVGLGCTASHPALIASVTLTGTP